MSITADTFLNIEDSHLRVVSGNVYAQAINISGINLDAAHGLQSVTNTGNQTFNTLQLSNETTGLVTTANAQIGQDLVVSGNTTVAKTLTISEHLIASKEATVTGNLHVTTIRSDSNVVTEYTGPHDRPLRKYPEVALTANSDKGYVAIGSSNGSGSYPEYTAFDGVVTNSTTGWASDGTYASGTGISTFSWNGSFGEYLSLELPKALRLQKMFLKGYEHSGIDYQNAPRDIKLYGSNNETNWVLLKTETDLPIDSITNNSTYININATEHYKYIRLQITKTYRRTAAYTRIGELEYYGHEEGSGSLDTTLKTVYNVPATTGTQLEVYYDGRETSSYPESGVTVNDLALPANNGTLNGGVGFDPTYKAFTFDGTNDYIEGAVTAETGAWSHTIAFWIKIDQIPSSSGMAVFQIKDSSLADNVDAATSTSPHLVIDPGTGYINNAFQGNPGQFLDDNGNRLVAQTGVWQHYVVQYDASNGGTNYRDRKLIINGNKEYYPAGGTTTALSMVASNKLFIGCMANAGLNGPGYFFDGSIANFRLYSKALNADQVKELYDYQKDYFLGSKSQVTLYKGHLGVGVTEPSGQLELAGDERIQEYPPRDLGGFETLVEGQGTYKVSSSNDVKNPDLGDGTTSGTTTDHPAIAFTANSTFFRGVVNTYDSSSVPAPYTGTHFTNGIGGDFIQIELPHKIYLKSINITTRTNLSVYYDRGPHTGSIFGSNDGGTTWSQVASWTGLNWTLGESKPIQINSNTLYSTYRLVASELQNTVSPAAATRFNIDRWRLFGTPGPTTLDKGSLTLGRSLDVPRVSRYDVDTETPRPEKLLIDYDTTVNSSLTDISGKGNHGAFKGTNMNYSSADKAFVFNGTDDVIHTNLPSELVGDPTLTISMWVNPNTLATASGNYDTFIHIGANSQDDQIQLAYYGFNGSHLQLGGYGQGMKTNDASAVPIGQWTHLCAVITPGAWSATTKKLYINGEFFPTTLSGSGTSSIPTGSTTSRLVFGGVVTGSGGYTHHANFKMSNPKIYNVALEPSEVKKLYNLGRTGRSMVISDTAVGIGKAPEAQLDVRGNLNVDGVITNQQRPAFYVWRDGTGNNVEAIGHGGQSRLAVTGVITNWDSKRVDTAGTFDLSNGRYYIPVSGLYMLIGVGVYRYQSGSAVLEASFYVNGSNVGPRGISYNRGNTTSEHHTVTITFMRFMNVGDYVQMGVPVAQSACDLYYGDNLGYFSGYLLG